jgi:hypothetical protein
VGWCTTGVLEPRHKSNFAIPPVEMNIR